MQWNLWLNGSKINVKLHNLIFLYFKACGHWVVRNAPHVGIPDTNEKGHVLWALGSYILGQTYWRLCTQNRITNGMAFSQCKIVRNGGELWGTREQSVLKIPGALKHTLGVGRRDRWNINKEPSRVPHGVNGVDVEWECGPENLYFYSRSV